MPRLCYQCGKPLHVHGPAIALRWSGVATISLELREHRGNVLRAALAEDVVAVQTHKRVALAARRGLLVWLVGPQAFDVGRGFAAPLSGGNCAGGVIWPAMRGSRRLEGLARSKTNKPMSMNGESCPRIHASGSASARGFSPPTSSAHSVMFHAA